MSGRKCQWGGCAKAATDPLIMVGVTGSPDGWFCAEHAAIHLESAVGKRAGLPGRSAGSVERPFA